MKTIFSIFCMLSVLLLISACDNNDSGGSSTGSIPPVSWDLYTGNNSVTCYNADNSVITNPYQTCTWNCATLNDSAPRLYKVTFLWDEATDEYTVESIQQMACAF